MTAITTATFAAHLAACVAQDPTIANAPPQRALAHAIAESALHPWAIHDNATNRDLDFETPAAAVAKARELHDAGRSFDAGIMQVNVGNFAAYGLSIHTVFDVRANICVGAKILAEAFTVERRAACRYQSGRPVCPAAYPDRVDRIQAQLAPVQAEAAMPVDSSDTVPPFDPETDMSDLIAHHPRLPPSKP